MAGLLDPRSERDDSVWGGEEERSVLRLTSAQDPAGDVARARALLARAEAHHGDSLLAVDVAPLPESHQPELLGLPGLGHGVGEGGDHGHLGVGDGRGGGESPELDDEVVDGVGLVVLVSGGHQDVAVALLSHLQAQPAQQTCRGGESPVDWALGRLVKQDQAGRGGGDQPIFSTTRNLLITWTEMEKQSAYRNNNLRPRPAEGVVVSPSVAQSGDLTYVTISDSNIKC